MPFPPPDIYDGDPPSFVRAVVAVSGLARRQRLERYNREAQLLADAYRALETNAAFVERWQGEERLDELVDAMLERR